MLTLKAPTNAGVTRYVANPNSVTVLLPHLLPEWSPNNTRDPDTTSARSNIKVEWVCPEGHTYTSVTSGRLRGSGCPYCAGKRPILGETDLKTLRPDLAAQWSTKNELGPEEYTLKSGKRVWWVCDKGHEWDTKVYSRSNGDGCPMCSGRRRTDGNSLQDLHPDYMKMWSPRNTLDPKEVSPHSNTKAYWFCENGHESYTPIANKVIKGVGCLYCQGKKPILGKTDLATLHPETLLEWSTKNDKKPHEVTRGSGYRAIWECSEGHEWSAQVNDRVFHRTGCPHCYQPSKAESDIAELFPSDLEVIRNTRNIIAPYELDIYIPSKNIAIEFNGLYWHTEDRGKDKNYHYNKWKACHDQGIQLITVWEDDWLYRREIVARMLKHKLGLSTDEVVYARRCVAVVLPKDVAWDFLNDNHIQGHAYSSVYLGLTVGSQLVAVMSLTLNNKSTQSWTLDRYATSCKVTGGHSKLLKFFTTTHAWSQIVTFADLSVSDGTLYEKTGWRLDKALKPDYKYVVGGVRKHKFGYRIKRFKDDPNLKYVEGYTESQLAQLNDLKKVWDCGKLRYVLENDNVKR